MTWSIVFVVLAILLPPLAAYVVVGLGTHFWLDLVLTLLGWVPGTIHALWLVLARPAVAKA